ncbi:MAG: prepilin-type N-terminal cleavage/methylation domain-containing protein [Nitrospiraceae bacterium]|nr:MAG: prepilin-type N-terminal cleavage/methylation domain-containing protein [Nitrospiraceae bacterium]
MTGTASLMRTPCKLSVCPGPAGRAGQAATDPVRGFTLLEVVIAITVMTLIILGIGEAFRLGMGAWDKGEEETQWTQRFRILSGMFSQQIKSAYPYKMDIEGEEVVLFEGEADSILFATALADPPYGGFKWVRYSHKDGAILQKEGLLPDKELTDHVTGEEDIVDSDIEEFRFSYYSQEDNEWKDSWDYEDALPGAVKIKISYFEPFLITIPMGLTKEDDEDEAELL